MNKKMRTKIIGITLILFVLVLSGCSYKNKTESQDIGVEAAKSKIEKLIADGGGSATIKDAVVDGVLYKITIEASGQVFPVYVTKDGTKFIQQAMSFEEIEKQQTEAKKQAEEENKEIPKSDKPVVDLYVMSFCPFGNKAEDTLKPVHELLKNKVDFNFYYIVNADGNTITSLHGQPEVDQNIREACVMKNYGKDAWMNFVTYVNANCGTDGNCWEEGAKKLKLDTGKISSCVSAQGTSLMKADAEKSKEAGATGSPTMFINGQKTSAVYRYGNSEEYKNVICSAFNNPPAECGQVLSSETSTTGGGSCGG